MLNIKLVIAQKYIFEKEMCLKFFLKIKINWRTD